MDHLSILNIVSASVASFLGLHFIFQPIKSHVYLGLFLLFTTISVLASDFEHPILIALSSPFLLAPLLLFFLLAVTNEPIEKVRKLRWLFLFAGLDSFLSFFFETKDLPVQISVLVSSVFNVILFYWMLLKLQGHAKLIQNVFSAIEGKQLIWLRNLILVNIAFSVLWLLDDSLSLTLGENIISEICADLSHFSTLLTILWIGFAGLRQFQIFEPEAMEVLTPKVAQVPPNPELQERYEEVVKRVREEGLFLDNNLSLQDLSRLLEMKQKDLSQIINLGFKENFYHFINHFRIQHFKYLVQSGGHQKMSLEGLSKEVGFNSKSTFYAAFKKVEGMTPRAFVLKQNLSE